MPANKRYKGEPETAFKKRKSLTGKKRAAANKSAREKYPYGRPI